MSTQNTETPDFNRRPLMADEFLTYEELMTRLPPKTTRDAIRKLIDKHGLPVHRIGLYRYIYVRELIEASGRPPSDGEAFDDDQEE